eukprot:3311010-Lingulodinium_polyedra.AAC.1
MEACNLAAAEVEKRSAEHLKLQQEFLVEAEATPVAEARQSASLVQSLAGALAYVVQAHAATSDGLAISTADLESIKAMLGAAQGLGASAQWQAQPPPPEEPGPRLPSQPPPQA